MTEELKIVEQNNVFHIECRIDYVMYFIDNDGEVTPWRYIFLSEESANKALLEFKQRDFIV